MLVVEVQGHGHQIPRCEGTRQNVHVTADPVPKSSAAGRVLLMSQLVLQIVLKVNEMYFMFIQYLTPLLAASTMLHRHGFEPLTEPGSLPRAHFSSTLTSRKELC